MEGPRETRLTLALCGLCLALLAVAWAPRLAVRRLPVAPLRPALTVAISGAVRAPGRYELPWGARVGDLVAAAGGLAPHADPALVNLADPLSEGEAVAVPALRTAAGDARISINGAAPRELEALPGIGPALAARIVAGRPFRRVEELLAVPGIGPATLERLRPRVTL